MQTDHDLIVIGRITGIYGVKGWVRVFSHTQPKENILIYTPWLLGRKGNWQAVALEDGRQHGKGIIAKLEHCDDRDQAADMVGQDIAIKQKQLASLDADEYYWADLIGLEVVNERQERLGKVLRLIETGANDVLVVTGQKDILIPFARPQIIKSIDLETGIIVVDWEADY